VTFELGERRGQCDLGGRLDRIAVDAGRDGRKRDGAAVELGGNLERAPVTRGQELGLALVAAAPDRADRVDHVARRELARGRGLCVAGLAAADKP